jgi:hypothetical protein
MKHLLLTLSLLLAVLFSPAQKNLEKILEAELSEYFPILPFGKTWPQILSFYDKDSNYVIDSAAGSTDTTMLYIRGKYKSFNPFTFTAKKDNIICIREDSNYIIYQLTALLDSTPLSKELCEKEFKIIHKKFRKVFQRIRYSSEKKKKKDPYQWNTYWGDNQQWYFELGWSDIDVPYHSGYYITVMIEILKDEKDRYPKKK